MTLVSLRDTVDRGYECLLIGDACAATKLASHMAALDTVTNEGGIFGAVAKARDYVFRTSRLETDAA